MTITLSKLGSKSPNNIMRFASTLSNSTNYSGSPHRKNFASAASVADIFIKEPGWLSFLRVQLPFINEAANVLQHTFLPGAYPDSGPGRLSVDTAALSSIMWNAARDADKGPFRAFMHGVGLLAFSFIIPTFFIPFVQHFPLKMMGGEKSLINRIGKFPVNLTKFGLGIGAIALLEVLVKIWNERLTPWLERKLNLTPN